MGGKRYPSEYNKLLKELTPRQLETLKKDNPFRAERNALIHVLTQRGVGCDVLARLTGLKRSSTHRIGQTAANQRPLYIKRIQPIDEKNLRKAFDAFYVKIMKILTAAER
jgi:hypothetical protein